MTELKKVLEALELSLQGMDCAIENADKNGDEAFLGYVLTRDKIIVAIDLLEEHMERLDVLLPFELVQGDTASRLSPDSGYKLNTNAAWAVSSSGRSAYKVRWAIEEINKAQEKRDE